MSALLIWEEDKATVQKQITRNSPGCVRDIFREENMNTQSKYITNNSHNPPAASHRHRTKKALAWLILALSALGQLLTLGTASSAPAQELESQITCQQVTLPVSLQEGQPATYQIAGQLCYQRNRKNIVHLLVSGATYSHVYWDFPVRSQLYSYVRALTRAGYATFNFDRIGIGDSDHPPADQTTIEAGAWVVHQIVQALRDGRIGSFSTVVLVGHSLGSGIALSEQARYGDANGIILSGFLHAFGPGFAQVPSILYPAQMDPRFANRNIPDGYLTTLTGSRPLFYFTPLADPDVIALDESTKETITLGEINTFPPLVVPPSDAQSIHVPVLIAIGSNDNVF